MKTRRNRAWQVTRTAGNHRGIIGVETRWGDVSCGKRGFWTRWRRCHLTIRVGGIFLRRAGNPSCSWRDEQDDPLNLKGSFAGAMGYGQFMPS